MADGIDQPRRRVGTIPGDHNAGRLPRQVTSAALDVGSSREIQVAGAKRRAG
jgi:hypothetical protein